MTTPSNTNMFGILLILFTVLPALELYVLIRVGSRIGPLNTILIVIIMGIFGAWLARLQGFLIMEKVQRELNQGKMPSDQLLDGALILAGAIALLTPGFISDFLGFLLLIPWTRAAIKLLFKKKIKAMMDRGEVVTMTSLGRSEKKYKDIDI